MSISHSWFIVCVVHTHWIDSAEEDLPGFQTRSDAGLYFNALKLVYLDRFYRFSWLCSCRYIDNSVWFYIYMESIGIISLSQYFEVNAQSCHLWQHSSVLVLQNQPELRTWMPHISTSTHFRLTFVNTISMDKQEPMDSTNGEAHNSSVVTWKNEKITKYESECINRTDNDLSSYFLYSDEQTEYVVPRTISNSHQDGIKLFRISPKKSIKNGNSYFW